MKKIIFILFLPVFLSCKNPGNTNELNARIDSLEGKLSKSYKPGFGEFMSNIQAHHAKLWFAGTNQNWDLAGFEMHEIDETLEAIRQYQADRKESAKLGMLQPAIDSITNAITQKNVAQFRTSYVLLTNTCNACHRETDFGFNVVKIPENSSFNNQDFRTSAN